MIFTLSFRIRVLRTKMAACLREVARGVLSYLDRLVCLEGELESLETKPQATKQSKPVQSIFDVMETLEEKANKVCQILAESGGGYVAKLWKKHGKNRIYISKDNGRRLNGYGYIDIDNNWDCSTVDGWANHWAIAAVREVIGDG